VIGQHDMSAKLGVVPAAGDRQWDMCEDDLLLN